ncbi:FprA family A-type flavoprotein [Desulfonatronospira sp. MSAO_Bac3]|uniref:FprA family A-type flavoprotein n=1 Tax=Desulfonatronospira sp. MSAO_Bac3 TaxID=2293857 RepID=UPI000FF7D68E|nr:FprA family A-type flavoprotein [Desulfonatronospira sp. MSAO_Bac3]RQD74389.1 MAG: FprA family A-type flavoprotein [Desulfonatronospira sp. MSAO_Bac3]
MPAIEIKKNVYWVGAIDWNLKNFHGYAMARRGTTYNAFLVLDDKITLFDTVSEKFKWDLYHQVRSLVKLEEIDYIVVNHVELDHSGALPFMVDNIKPEKIFCSSMGEKSIHGHFHNKDWPLQVVKDGESISLGKRNVTFMETRMLHWPDSMFSYIPEDKLLISSDAFGQNIASQKIFDDQHDLNLLLSEARHYYTNIILPFSPLVQKLLDKVQKAGLEIDMIAPDHGVIWRTHPGKILEAYADFAAQTLKPKAVLVYDTMWGSTEKMVKAVADALTEEGIDIRVMSLKSFHHSDVMGEFSDAAALVCASPTHNNGMLPLMSDFLTYMKGLKPKNRLGAALGSYGWSGEAPGAMAKVLEEAGFELPEKPYRTQFVPAHEQLAQCKELGRNLASAIKAKTQA